MFRTLRSMGLDAADLEFHPHNDTWLVVANCLAAIREGCAVINGTALGKGNGPGMPAGSDSHALDRNGIFCPEQPDFRVLNELAALYETMGSRSRQVPALWS